jgi:hypothetical protein
MLFVWEVGVVFVCLMYRIMASQLGSVPGSSDLLMDHWLCLSGVCRTRLVQWVLVQVLQLRSQLWC